tara:strand:- start:110 stop:511 length:402 start_codon:yes stop_codon:yes gene_type:complete
MKKLLLLLLFTILIFSCGSSDDSDNDYSNTSIVGSWQLTSILENGIPAHEKCDLESIMTMLETNKGNFTQYYSEDDTSDSCDESATIDLTWSLASSSTYNLTFLGVGESVSAVLEGETLTIGDGDEVIVFTKN